MSLLMDALKKAELAKRQGRDSGTTVAAAPEEALEMSLEPLPIGPIVEPGPVATEKPLVSSLPDAPESTATAPDTLPDLSAHLEKLDADFLAAARQQASANRIPPAPRKAPEPALQKQSDKNPVVNPPRSSTRQDQAAAQNVFIAKQPASTPRKTFALAVGSATLLAGIAIGGYFWWQLQPKSTLAAHPGTASPSWTPPQTPGLAAPHATTPAASPVADQVPPVPATQPIHANSTDKDKENEKNNIALKTRPQQSAERSRAEARDEPVRLTRTPSHVDPALMRGFDAFNRGDLAIARMEYERALKSDPRNTDALHGLAAVALRQGHPDQAEWLYQQALEANPQDPEAQSALINLRGQVDPVATESRLKTLVAEQPELAAPHFALGNLYARQGRWSEAQSAYFRAWNIEPDNPDVLYNLAVSLEHLHQTRLAIQYYGQAIAAANARPASFDRIRAEARLHALQP